MFGNLKKTTIKVNEDPLLEYERLKQNDLFTTIKRKSFLENTLTVLAHNVKSLSKQNDDSQ